MSAARAREQTKEREKSKKEKVESLSVRVCFPRAYFLKMQRRNFSEKMEKVRVGKKKGKSFCLVLYVHARTIRRLSLSLSLFHEDMHTHARARKDVDYILLF